MFRSSVIDSCIHPSRKSGHCCTTPAVDVMFPSLSVSDTAVAVFGLLSVYLLLQGLLIRQTSVPLPPGPRPLPLIGNVHQLPAIYQERTFREWGKKYGNIIFARMFQTSVIIVNSLSIAKDLLEKRSQNYSGRPMFTLLTELYVSNLTRYI